MIDFLKDESFYSKNDMKKEGVVFRSDMPGIFCLMTEITCVVCKLMWGDENDDDEETPHNYMCSHQHQHLLYLVSR